MAISRACKDCTIILTSNESGTCDVCYKLQTHKRKLDRCTTHHHACDCHEREFEKIREQRDELLAACEEARLVTCYMGGDLGDKINRLMSSAIKKSKGE